MVGWSLLTSELPPKNSAAIHDFPVFKVVFP